MSLNLLSMAVLAIAVYFGMPLVQQGRVEGYLLIVFGLLAGVAVEYMVSELFNRRLCPQCGRWMRKNAGLLYCKGCRRFWEEGAYAC